MIEKLNKSEMNELKGGVSVEEYCETLSMIIDHNWDTMSDGSRKAAAKMYARYC